MKRMIHSDKAPQAIGPYSQAIKAGGFLYVSGQLPIDPVSGVIMGDCVKTQTEQVLQNIKLILEATDYALNDVVKSTVFLSDMNNFSEMNTVYGTFFQEPYPARAAFAVKSLPKNALVEIEIVAYKQGDE